MSARVRRPLKPPDPLEHMRWARMIGRAVRRDFKFLRGQAEEQELEAVAYLELCRCCRPPDPEDPQNGGFDPAKVPAGADPVNAFRGWAYHRIKGKCKEEARRLRGGGMYWSPKYLNTLPTAEPGSDHEDEDGQWDVTDTRDGPPAPDPPLVLLGTVRKRDAGKFQ